VAKFKVIHSDDACLIDIRGDVRNPEPSTAIIKFPCGHVEVSRHSDGSYWVHVERNANIGNPDEDLIGAIVESRIDFAPDAYAKHGGAIPSMPAQEDIQHMAIRIARADVRSLGKPAAVGV
jgi:hypothetical protein